MALMSKPALLLLDEPTTALDVTVEAGIVELVKDLGEEFGTSMIFMSHNLGLILETCDRITRHVFRRGGRDRHDQGRVRPHAPPLHAGAVPLDPAARRRQELAAAGRRFPGSLPLPHERPKGCNFGPRCHHFVEGRCDAAEIPMIPVEGHDGHFTPLRPLRRDRLERAAGRRQGEEGAGRARRRRCSKIDGPEEILQGFAPTRSSAAARRGRQGQRDDQLRWRARPRRSRSSANPAAASRPSQRCCSASRPRPSGTVTLGNKDIQSTGDRDARRADRLVDPDGVPESVRHAEPQPFGRLADHPHAGKIQASAGQPPTGASACSSCSTW